MNGDKTKIAGPNIKDGGQSADNQTTMKSPADKQFQTQNKYDDTPTIQSNENGMVTEELTTEKEISKEDTLDEIDAAKTALMFGKGDIQKKLRAEFDDVPEIGDEDLEPEYLSSLLKSPFPHKSSQEQMRLNRNFLRDAEPFKLDRLMEDIKKAPEELLLGFREFDSVLAVPPRQLTLITARPGHGKTVFMLNTMLNMARKYTPPHFLYYTYRESRSDVEIKLINMCGEQPFVLDPEMAINSNFKRWKHELKSQTAETLMEKAGTDPAYKGINVFGEVAPRIHIIDSGYNIVDLLDSISAFMSTLPIGGVFIDHLQGIAPEPSKVALPRQQQLQEIAYQLKEIDAETTFPILLGVTLGAAPRNLPEYDGLSLDFLKEAGDPELVSGLIIALQNYARSEFIGSNNGTVHSRYVSNPLTKAEKMPDTFKDKRAVSVLLAKVLANRNGPLPETELLYNKWLMKVSDSAGHTETS